MIASIKSLAVMFVRLLEVLGLTRDEHKEVEATEQHLK